jgi:hypothetical protein
VPQANNVSKVVSAIAVVSVSLFLGLFLFMLIVVSPAVAQAEVEFEFPDADYSFGQYITFRLNANSLVTISEVNLFLRVAGQSGTIAVPVSFQPGTRVAVEFPYSMVGGEIPPFSTITYWWEVRDESGRKHDTEKKLLYYADNRNAWRSVEDGQKGISLEVFWVQGDVVFGQTALNVAVGALDEIFQELLAPVPGVIRVFVYPSEDDLRSALSLAGYDWAGGQARPDLGVVLVGIPVGPGARGEMERLIPHELTHLLVYEASGRALGQVPPWLNEGLATLNERRPDSDRDTLLAEALAEDRLLPLEALCAPFPADEESARLAYAQSASVVRYLREEYGNQTVRELLAAYAEGLGCEEGVNRVLGLGLEGLDTAWRAQVTSQEPVAVALTDSAPWLALWLLTALLALPLLGVLRGSLRDRD